MANGSLSRTVRQESLPEGAADPMVFDGSMSGKRPGPAQSYARRKVLAVINPRDMDRECFIRSIRPSHSDLIVEGYKSVDDFLSDDQSREAVDAILYRFVGESLADAKAEQELSGLVMAVAPLPVIVLGASEDLHQMMMAVDLGARGYIPESVGIDDVVEATYLTAGGGIFLPLSSMMALRDEIARKPTAPCDNAADQFTTRQTSVANALRRGKSNKIIAYELNMCESTVKVHVRNILKKLGATNRTEAAFRLNTILSQDGNGAR